MVSADFREVFGGCAMTKLEVLGTGCPTCRRLSEMVERAAGELGIEFELEKVTEIDAITAFGVMATPALVVDGEVKVSGRLPSLDEIKDMIG